MAKISREEISNAQQQYELTLLNNLARIIYWPKVRRSS